MKGSELPIIENSLRPPSGFSGWQAQADSVPGMVFSDREIRQSQIAAGRRSSFPGSSGMELR